MLGSIPVNNSHCPKAGLMLFHRLRRWPNITPALGQFLVFIGLGLLSRFNVLTHPQMISLAQFSLCVHRGDIGRGP